MLNVLKGKGKAVPVL